METRKVLSRNGKMEGKTTGASYACQLSGCMGRRLSVKWPDGHYTFPCTKGMLYTKGKWRIL